MERRIPKSFKLFGNTINVIYDNIDLNKRKLYGESIYSRFLIVLSTEDNHIELNDDVIMDTFYHEKIHMILDSMGRHELSSDESFVDIFSKLLKQADYTENY